VGSLTQIQRSVIIGSLLGDGYLRIVRGRKNALLEINHSFNARDYVDWKYAILQSIAGRAPKMRHGNGQRIAYRFTTRQLSELTQFHSVFYRDGKKTIPDDMKLDSIILAVWYMDDGSKCREQDVYLNTQQFSEKDQQKCRGMLAEMGIESFLNRDKIYWRLRIKKSSLPTFWKSITPYIIPTMRYKLSYNPVETHPERKRRVELRHMPELIRQPLSS